jgi:HAD superfamily hydrolase (TIGR01549 family)
MHRAHEATPPLPGETARYTERWFYAYIPRVFGSVGASPDSLDGLVPRLRERYRAQARLKLFPETERVLATLRRRGIRTGLVSNWSPRLRVHLDALRLTESFDAILVSAIEGVEKPSAEIFHRACQRVDVKPEATLHVGDHLENDARGALAAGLRAVWLDRTEGATAPPADPPVPVIRNLESLLPMIGVNP